MSLEIPKSNFYFIEENFKDIIEEIRDGINDTKSDIHIHTSSDTRMFNDKFRELVLILEFIRLRQASLEK